MKTLKKTVKEEAKVVDTTLPRINTSLPPSGRARYSAIGKNRVADTLSKDADTLFAKLQKLKGMYPDDPVFAAHLEDIQNQVTQSRNRASFHYGRQADMACKDKFHAQAATPPAMESFTSEKALLEDIKKNLC